MAVSDSVRLVDMERELLNMIREDDVPGSEIPGIYLSFLKGRGVGRLDGVIEHNGHDLVALAAILGHNYSPWIGFKGGKGIATSAGALLALMPAAVVILVLILTEFYVVPFLVRRCYRRADNQCRVK